MVRISGIQINVVCNIPGGLPDEMVYPRYKLVILGSL